MTNAQVLIAITCGLGALMLSLGLAYWLGFNTALRGVERDDLDATLTGILSGALTDVLDDDEDEDEDDGGIRVEARA